MSVQEIFLAAIDINDLQQRAVYVAQACGDDEASHRKVQALLAAHERSGEFLDIPAMEQIAGVRSQAAKADHDQNSQDEIDLSFLQPSSRPDSLGRLLHYEVLEIVGRGGCGIVLKAFDEKLHRVVAIKTMTPELAVTSPARKRFLREARATAAIRHENVVSIYAVEEKPLPFLVMEFIDGQTLQDKINECGPLDVRDVVSMGRQIACGLEAAHIRGLIHRDIKPANILLESGTGRPKITDFGLARSADDASLTQSGAISGTPLYMSPEQAQGLVVDKRSDIFSLGSVLYVMCSGRPPFRASTVLAVLKRVVEEQPRAIREILPDVPEWLIAIITRLHAKKPAERFSSAQAVVELLERGNLAQQTGGPIPIRQRRLSIPPAWYYWGIAMALVVALGLVSWSGPSFLTSRTTQPERTGSGSTSQAAAMVPLELEEVLSAENKSSEPTSPIIQPPGIDAPPMAAVPFNAEQAQRHQQAWADFLEIPVEFTNSIGMKFILIPPGNFLMGSPTSEPGREGRYIGSETPHWVELTHPFYMGVHEVTQDDYQAVMGHNPSAFSQGGENADKVKDIETDRFPVEMVSWNDAQDFCKTLKGLPGEQDRLYRLPTEAEWEFSCRAGTTTATYVGDSLTFESGSFAGTFPYQSTKKAPFSPHPAIVGSYPPNAFGLYDMIGNLCEWCEDTYDYGVNYYANSPIQNPLNTVGFRRVRRGGCFNAAGQFQRSAARYSEPPIDRNPHYGFRVVAEVALKNSGKHFSKITGPDRTAAE